MIKKEKLKEKLKELLDEVLMDENVPNQIKKDMLETWKNKLISGGSNLMMSVPNAENYFDLIGIIDEAIKKL